MPYLSNFLPTIKVIHHIHNFLLLLDTLLTGPVKIYAQRNSLSEEVF